MIKIIQGVYGYKEESGRVIPKTSKDEPFSLSEKQEARLVNKKVAVYVKPEEADANEDDDDQEKPEYNESMKLDDLKNLAEDYGLDTTNLKSKAVVIKALDNFFNGTEESEDGELPPSFDALTAE